MSKYGERINRANRPCHSMYVDMPIDTYNRIKDISGKCNISMSKVLTEMVSYALEHVQITTRMIETSTFGFDGGSKHV